MLSSPGRFLIIRPVGMLDIRLNYLKKRWVQSLIILILSFLVYAPSLANKFVWDDVIVIQQQSFKFSKSSSFKKLIPKFRKNSKVKKKNKINYYRPMIFYSIVLDHRVWGNNPFGYHLTNSFLFSLSSLLFFFLVLLILKEFHIGSKEYIAGLATLIYILHPMHVESVSWISGRSDIICSIFFLSAFIFHIFSYRKILFFPFALLMLYFSFLSKEVAVAFPFLVLCFDLVKSKDIRLRKIYISLAYFLLLIFYFFIRSKIIPDFSTQTIGKPPGVAAEFVHYIKAIIVMLNSYLYYFIKLVFPFKFNAFISQVPKENYFTVISVFVFSLLSIWSYISVRYKTRLQFFAIFWILITLAPSVLVSIFKIATTPLAERYLFLPICGFSVLVSYLVWPYFRRSKTRNVAIIIFSLVCVVLLFFNIQRQFVWKDRITLWNDISLKSVDSSIAKINQGMALIEGKELDEGIKILESIFKSKTHTPRYVKSIAANNIGIAYIMKNKPEVARKWFQKGIKFHKGFYKSYYHIALIDYMYARKVDSLAFHEKSEKNLRKAIKLNKKYAKAYFLLAKVYLAYYETEEAKVYAQKALDYGLTPPFDKQARLIISK